MSQDSSIRYVFYIIWSQENNIASITNMMVETQCSGERCWNYSEVEIKKYYNKVPLHNGNNVKQILTSSNFQKVGFSKQP